MREYIVQPGDTPASIAIEHAGCPKCSIDLVRAAPHKAVVVYPNGYRTFKELRAGEKLTLPEKWFTPEFDALPPAYFAALPHPDGVTPSKLGPRATGVLGDYSTLDSAIAHAAMLTPMDNQAFSAAVGGTSTLLDRSVREADGSTNPGIAAYAQATHLATGSAMQRNLDLIKAIQAGNQPTADQARIAVQNDLLTAIDSARLALGAVYGGTSKPAASTVLAAAQAAAAAIAADPGYCVSVAHSGTSVNAAVHAFKTAWNAANPSSPVPVGTGTYEQATADALARALGTSAPAACAVRVSVEFGTPIIDSPRPQQDQGLSTGAVIGIGLLGAGAVGAALYFATRKPAPQVRRVLPRVRRVSPNPMLRPTIPPWRTTP